MHMADALITPAVGATFWAGTVAAIVYASKRLKEMLDDKMVPLMGVLGAFIFAAQMVNFTIPGTGSSGHLGGGLILAILLGPAAAFLVMASVLTVQALFFADGGLLALGCNIWNLGIYPCFIAYPLIYRPISGRSAGPGKALFAAVAAGVVGLQLGSFSVILQTLLSGKSELPFGSFALLIQPIHLVIGVVEGLVTAGVIRYVRSLRPELLDREAGSGTQGMSASLRTVLVSFAVLALVTGGVLSWFASEHPDGLEWAVQKVTGRSGMPEHQQGIGRTLHDVQKRTSVMPDYALRGGGAAETSLAGIFGAAAVLSVSLLVGFGIRFLRNRKTP